MAVFKIDKFAGKKSLRSGGREGEEVAENAENCLLRGGVIRPLKRIGDAVATVVNNARTLFRYHSASGADHWWGWAANVSMVRSPVINDIWNRIYWSMPNDANGSPQTPRYRPEHIAGTPTVTADTPPRIPLPAMPENRDGVKLGVPAPAGRPMIVEERVVNMQTGDVAVIPVPDSIPAMGLFDFTVRRLNRRRRSNNTALFPFTTFSEQESVLGGSTGLPVYAGTNIREDNAVGWPYFLGAGALPSTTERDYNIYWTGTYQRVRVRDYEESGTPFVGEAGEEVPFRVHLGTVKTLEALTAINISTWTNATAMAVSSNTSVVYAEIGDMSVLVNRDTNARDVFSFGAYIGRDATNHPLIFYYPPNRPGLESVLGSSVAQPLRFKSSLAFELIDTGGDVEVGGVIQPGTESEVTEATVQSRAFRINSYVFTYVTRYGEEGPPSLPSAIVWGNLREVTIPLTIDLTTAPENIRDGGKVRLYRSNATDTTPQFQFLADVEIPSSTTDSLSYSDEAPTSILAEVLPSRFWYPPPSGLQGLIALDNGSLAGFIGRDVHFSEPNIPHAWPAAYRIRVERDVVAIAQTSYGLHVLTTGIPVLLTGTPGAFEITTSEHAEACVDARTVVRMSDSLFYFSPDGLTFLTGVEARLLTRSIMTSEQWVLDYLNKGLRGYYWDDRYVAVPDGSVANAKGFIFESDVDGIVDYDGQNAGAGWTDRGDGSLYLAVADAMDPNFNVVRFHDGPQCHVWLWESKIRSSAQFVAFMRALPILLDAMDGEWLHIEIATGSTKDAAYTPAAMIVCASGSLWQPIATPAFVSDGTGWFGVTRAAATGTGNYIRIGTDGRGTLVTGGTPTTMTAIPHLASPAVLNMSPQLSRNLGVRMRGKGMLKLLALSGSPAELMGLVG